MRELACQFAEHKRLNGVITIPVKPTQMALVLVSAGLIAKAGPCRLYTQAARELASRGVTVLRFDLGGIGNSQQIFSGLPLTARTRADIAAAVDFLEQKYDARQFILGGLCSGAEDSFRYSETDERIAGVVLIDPHAYKTSDWQIRRYLSRFYINRIINKYSNMFNINPIPAEVSESKRIEGLTGELIDYKYMDKVEALRILESLIQRNCKVHYIYTGGRRGTFNHKGQFAKMFKRPELTGKVTLTHIPHIEHEQIFQQDRQELIDAITHWYSNVFT